MAKSVNQAKQAKAKADAVGQARALAPNVPARIGSTPATKFRGNPEIFGRLVEDHDKHRALLAMIEATAPNDPARKALFEEFVRDVHGHAAAEGPGEPHVCACGEHDHEDFDTFVVDLPSFASPKDLADRMIQAAERHDVLRMKGFADIAGKPMRLLVQGVGARIQHQFDRRWAPDEQRRGRLVVIGEKGFDKAAIHALITG